MNPAIELPAKIPLGSLATTMPLRLSPGSGWIEHIPFAFWLVEHLKPELIVELGVQSGASYSAFCQAVSLLGLPAQCIGVDTFAGDPHSGFYGPEILEDLRAFHDPLYSRFSKLVQGTFANALGQVADGSIDLLHIDGSHFYEDVRHDFESWLPKLSRHAVVLFHDIGVTERGFGVGRLWDELKQSHPFFEFHHSHGLGVLAVSDIPNEAIRSLVEAPSAAQATVRHLFSALGNRLTLLPKGQEASGLHHEVQALGAQQVLVQNAFMELAGRLQESEKAARAEAKRLNAAVHKQQCRAEQLWIKNKELNKRWIKRSFKSRWVARFPWLNGPKIEQQCRLVRKSGLFDARHYRAQLPYGFHPLDPVVHYLRVGWKCGLSPHPLFDAEWYLKRYPTVAQWGDNPFVDYLRGGATQDRWPNPQFDADAYLDQHHGKLAPGQTPLAHFLISEAKH